MNATGPAAYPRLLSPFRLGSVELRNRLVFQPHFTALTGSDGLPNDALRAYFVERAMGGVSLIIDGHMAVMAEGQMAPQFIRAWESRIGPLYRRITDEVHANGARIFGQVTHAGHTSLTEPPPVLWAPTQMPEPSSRHTTRAMDDRDIRLTIKRFGVASRNLVDAGMDGIEVKVAHDGLLRSFASPFFNLRTDSWGGSFEKRMRFPLEVVAAIREAIGPDYPIGVRLCLDEYTAFGYGLDHGLRMAEAFESTGLVDYFNCDAGTFSSFWMEIPPAAVPQGYFRPLNQALKRTSSLPVIAFGRIKDPVMAEQMLELGEADLIGMARALIADPDLPNKLAVGRADEVRGCTGCNDGCIYQVMQVKPIRCVVSPGAGQEREYSDRVLLQTRQPKAVVVVGGGPAGLKAAEIAARRGHRVTLMEREPVLGGLVRIARRQPWHEEIGETTTYLEGALQRLRVDVRRGVVADVDGILGLHPDVVLIATGSHPDLPPGRRAARLRLVDGALAQERGLRVTNSLPGLERANVLSTDEVLDGVELPGTRALVIDAHGHWEAAGTAEFLADLGIDVEIVTSRAEVGFGLEPTNRVMFHQRARDKGIRLTPNTRVLAIEDEGVAVVDLLSGKERMITGFDLVVPVYPRASNDDLYFRLIEQLGDDSAVIVERIGDASAPRMLQSVILEAQQVAMSI